MLYNKNAFTFFLLVIVLVISKKESSVSCSINAMKKIASKKLIAMRKGNKKLNKILNLKKKFRAKNICHTFKGKHVSSCRTRSARSVL
jgi:hypothetical protein